MAKSYFTNLADVDLAKEAVAKNPDTYIQYREYSGSGVYATSTASLGTLTPATSPGWTVDEFISSAADNLLIMDDNNVVASAKITDNDADSITFDPTALLLESDGSTAATLTAASSYDFKVYSPSSVNTYGPFMGYVEGAELNFTDEMMIFKYSVPRKKKFQDLAERNGQITGGVVTFVNEDLFFTLLGASTFGSQTNQYSYGVGSEPDTDRFYRITFVTQDRTGRPLVLKTRSTQFALSGNFFNKSESGHYMPAFTAEINSDDFYPATADMMQIIRQDS